MGSPKYCMTQKYTHSDILYTLKCEWYGLQIYLEVDPAEDMMIFQTTSSFSLYFVKVLIYEFELQDGVRFYIYFDSDYELDADSVEEKNKVGIDLITN